MQKYTDVVTSARSGAAIPNARVTVKTYPGDVAATIYSDDGITEQDNPITTDARGQFSFYAADGRYSLVVSGTGITEQTLTDHVLLADPDDADPEQNAADVSFAQSGTGAIAGTVSGALKPFKSVLQWIPENLHASIAAGTNATDLTTYVQNAIDDVLATGGWLFFPDGTYKISAALTIPFSTGWRMTGWSRLGAIIKQETDNTPIFKFTSNLTHSWSVSDMKFDWANAQASTSTAACPFYFVGTSGTYFNYFNWTVERVNFANCCDCFGADSTTKFAIWGYVVRDITVQDTVSRSVAYWLPSVVGGGSPNGRFEGMYVLADEMVGPVFRLAGHHAVQMDNIEINRAYQSPTIISDLSGGQYIIGSLRVEDGIYSVTNPIFALGNGYLSADLIELSTFTIDAGTGSSPYVFSFSGGVDGESAVKVKEFKFSNSTISGGNLYLHNGSSSSGRVEIDYFHKNTLPTNFYLTNTGGSTSAEVTHVRRWANRHVSADKGDADYTFALGDPTTVKYETTLTANRTVTLPSISVPNNLFNGMSVTVVRDASGDFRLDVVRNGPTTLDSFPPNTTGEITFTWRRSGTGAWQVTSRVLRNAVGADVGDAAKTLTVGQASYTQVWNTAITADRAVTLSTTGAKNGDKWRIVRTAAATGAFNLNVGTGPLKAMGTAGSFCEVEYNGSAWVLTAYGPL